MYLDSLWSFVELPLIKSFSFSSISEEFSPRNTRTCKIGQIKTFITDHNKGFCLYNVSNKFYGYVPNFMVMFQTLTSLKFASVSNSLVKRRTFAL